MESGSITRGTKPQADGQPVSSPALPTANEGNEAGDRRRQLIQEKLNSRREDFGSVRFEKLAFSRSQGRVVLFLSAQNALEMRTRTQLEGWLRESCPLPQDWKIVISQPRTALETDAAFLEKTAKEFMVLAEPSLIPFISQCRVIREGVCVDIIFGREMGPDIMRRLHVDARMEAYLRETYGVEWKIRSLTCSSETLSSEERDENISRLFAQQQKASDTHGASAPLPDAPQSVPAPARERPAKPAQAEQQRGGERRRRGPKKLLTDKVSGKLTPMRSLQQDTEAVVEGELFNIECLLSKKGNTILRFDLTDHDTSISCRVFFFGDETAQAGTLKEGQWYRAKGTYKFESFARDNDDMGENVMSVSALAPTQAPPPTQDTCEDKRVELHLHTNMSTQDGISSASDYIRRAAQWGHGAIAITDHGVVQAFPDAASAVQALNKKRAPEDKFRLIFGMEAYMVDDEYFVYQGREHSFDDEFIVFDIETTGRGPLYCGITEIGAVRLRERKIVDRFQTFVDPGMPIPAEITALTGISEADVAGAPDMKAALSAFWDFAGDACLCAHNAEFDTGFIFGRSREMGLSPQNDVLDTLRVARAVCKDLRSYRLDRLAKHYSVPLLHHRAVNDAQATAEILLKMMAETEQEKGVSTLRGMNGLVTLEEYTQKANTYHTILLVRNKAGLRNLYKLVSASHLNFFYRRPRIPKSYIERHREGLIVGSACEQGEVFRSIFMNHPAAQQEKIASFYDYLEIQPLCNNSFLVREGSARGEEDLQELNRRIIALGDRLGKPTVATTDCHFLDPEDEIYRRIIMDGSGFANADEQAPLYFRTTDEMLREFSYLGEERAKEVVVKNPQDIAAQIEEIELFPGHGQTIMPEIEGADGDIRRWAYENIKKRYGDPLPELIEKRLERELSSIIRNGFSILYWIAKKLVEKSMEDGYLVGSRGSVGSSLAAYAMGITEVNPLPPHYLCPHCKHVDFDIDDAYGCGVDMPPAKCPVCGQDMLADGYDIPFEVFLGIDADKVPDIDLNFSGEYQPKAHKFIEQVFGEEYVYRAGTIGTIKEKTAEKMVLKYMEKRGQTVSGAEVRRLVRGCSGVKSTTGQHPGGMVIVPKSRDVYEFTPIQKPADKTDGDTVTTHFDFNSMHDILVKLDILGHDNPTMIRMLQDLIGFDPLTIPLNDPETMSLFTGTKALGIEPEAIFGIDVGTLGIPEFGTEFVRGMLDDTRPTTMSELVRIAGLSHGTDVWLGNAQELIEQGVAPLSGVICTRDDIMNYLVKKGVEQRQAFFTMESVRKGKWAKGKESRQAEQEAAMREAGVEEWFIESCRKIRYMFPKAHAVAYVVMSLRIAYCKVHYPREYYATIFTTKCEEFDATYVLSGRQKVENALRELYALGNKKTATEKKLMVVLELVLEMLARGIGFLPVDLQKSRARRFGVEGNNLRLPFMAIPKLGETAADMIEREAQQSEFLSVEDLRRRCKLPVSVIDQMREMGCLAGLPEKAQLSLFDVI